MARSPAALAEKHSRLPGLLGILAGLALLVPAVFADDPPDRPFAPKPDARGFVPLGPEGTVRFHPQEKVVEADGTFNMNYGFIEFLACAPGVKPHETIVALDVNPIHFNAALMMMGLDEKKARKPESDADLLPVAGDRVVIFLRWKTKDENGKEVVHEERAEKCILNALVEEEMERVGWVFTGSRFIEENPRLDDPPGGGDSDAGKKQEPEEEPKMIFAPLVIGQFIAVCHRPYAILDLPIAIPFVDAYYYANPEVLPPIDHDNPVEVTMVFRRPKPGEIDRSIVRMKIPPPPPPDEGDDANGDDQSSGDDSDD